MRLKEKVYGYLISRRYTHIYHPSESLDVFIKEYQSGAIPVEKNQADFERRDVDERCGLKEREGRNGHEQGKKKRKERAGNVAGKQLIAPAILSRVLTRSSICMLRLVHEQPINRSGTITSGHEEVSMDSGLNHLDAEDTRKAPNVSSSLVSRDSLIHEPMP